MAMQGIDISQWQGDINLAPYKGQFVIIRATYGSKTDPKAKRNMDECDRLGIPYGVYCYSYALNEAQAKGEAEYLLKVIKGRNIRVGVWFDMEDADGYKRRHGVTSSTMISAMCKAFCAKIEAAGYYAGIYASRSWLGTKIKGCDKYDKWVADWGSNNGTQTTNTSKLGTIQQYTSRPLDKNIMYADLSRYTKAKEEPKPSSTENKTKTSKIAVDGWWGPKTTKLTQKVLGTTVDGIVSNQPISNRKYLPKAAETSWQWKTSGYTGGSPMVKKIQKLVGAKQDGFFGKQTATKMQAFLGVKISGKLDEPTVKAWQQYINTKVK